MKKLSVFFTVFFCSLFQFSQAQYCVPTGTCMPGNHINAVKVSTLQGAALMNNTSNACGIYTDYSSLGAFDLAVGDSYTVEITEASTTAPIGTVYQGYAVWIDYDQSGTFDAAEAVVVYKGPGISVNGTNYGRIMTIDVPPSAVSGITRMRVKFSEVLLSQVYDNDYACETIEEGEVEDYIVNISNQADLTPSCAKTPIPSNTAIDICNTGTVLSFSAPDAAATPAQEPTGYLLSLWSDNGVVVDIEKDTDIGTATSFNIADVLTPGETYYWQVKPYNDFATNQGCEVWSFVTATTPNPQPIIAVDGDDNRIVSVCADLEAKFSLTDANGTSYGSSTFDWNGTDTSSYPLSDTSIANPVFNSSLFGTTYVLSLTVVDQFGCVGVDTVDVLVKERGTPGTILSDAGDKICEGETTNLTLTGYKGNVEWQYSYTSPTTGLVTTGDFDDAHTTFPILQNTYFIAIVDTVGCADTTSIYLEKMDLPFQPSVLNNGLTFCDGDSVYLEAVWPVSGDLLWDDITMSATNIIWLNEPGTYTVTGTASSTGCSNTSNPVSVTKYDVPNNPFVLEMGGNACEGDTLQIQVAISGADSLFWITMDGYDADLDINIKADAAYQFVNRSDEGCYSDTVDYAVTFGTPPSKPVINKLSNDSLQIIGDATTYYWYLEDGTLVSTEIDSIFEPSTNGTYYVIGGNGPCLSEPSDLMIVDLYDGITSIDGKAHVVVYPNPAKSFVKIELSHKGMIVIKDIFGKKVLGTLGKEGLNTIELFVSGGLYFVEIQIDGQKTMLDRLMVE